MHTAPHIENLLQQRSIVTHYQPLVSIKRRALLGYEALSRGCNGSGEAKIAPDVLFALPRTCEERLALDRLCRDKAFAGFKELHDHHRDLVLSINLDVALLDSLAAGSEYLAFQARQWGINPNNIVIELIESKVKNTDALLDFIQRYRNEGFLIALDDVGAGYSNMERIALIKPDVIKIDRSLINSIHKEFYKFEVTKSLVGLGQRIGAMVLAEGVETREEAIMLLELGVDVFQGYYFARPAPPSSSHQGALQRVQGVAQTFKEHMLRSISAKKSLYSSYDSLLYKLVGMLVRTWENEYDTLLASFMDAYPDLECLYVLNEYGVQISDTVCNHMTIAPNKRFIYQPAQRGADHSLKDYFLPIDAGLPKFTTEPYISMASGNICTTIAASFANNDGYKRILCMDVSRGVGR